jgi:NADH:ubiquinone oxidoreductase subunit C
VSEASFIDSLNTLLPGKIVSSEYLDSTKILVTVEERALLEVANSLKNDFGFTHPVSGGAVDYPDEEKMQMNYYLINPESKLMIIYRVDFPRNNPKIPSLTPIWEAMSFHEREANEMFGIDFIDHPNMIPLLLPPDWKGGYPLRKDFKGEGVEE